MTMTQNDLFSCCQAKTILTHEPVAAPRKKKSRKDTVYVTTSKHDTYKAILGIFRRTRQTNSTQNLHFPKKCCIFAEEKVASQQNIQASLIFCIRFAFSLHRQPKEVWQEPLRGHLLRPRSVTIDDQRRSSIKTPKEHYSKADRRHRATNKTPDTRAVTNAPTIS